MYLRNNQLAALPEGVFSGLGNLQRLYLDGNQLSALTEGMFAELGNLQRLYLDDNRLSTLTSEVFSGLDNLEWLTLGNNQLRTLPVAVFAELDNLKFLYIHNNQLSTLPAGTFSGLGNLQNLFIRWNPLITLPVGVFSGLGKLKGLTIGDSELGALTAGVFSDLVELQVLSLSNSQVSILTAGVLSGLDNLEFLSLNGNQMDTLTEGMFSGLGNLEILHLMNNQLSTLTAGVFAGLRSLQGLWLNGNREPLFNLKVGFEQPGGLGAVSGSAEFKLILREGAPGTITIGLNADGGTLSRNRVILLTGSTQSDVITVRRNIWSTVTVTADAPPLPEQTCLINYRPCYRGFHITAEDSLILEEEPSILSLEPTQLEVKEAGTATITVSSILPRLSSLTVSYLIGRDSNRYTADADDGDYNTNIVTGVFTIAPGATTEVIEIPITDDRDVEPTSETFTVLLTEPSADAGYILGSPFTATVVIREGICDRTPVVQRVIMDALSEDDCADVSSTDLAEIRGDLRLSGKGIKTLKQGDFSGMLNLEALRLDGNRLSTLTAGVFTGLERLQRLYLNSNALNSLPSDVFSGLSNLQILNLSFNETLDELPVGIFRGLKSLRRLHLGENNLSSLPVGVFSSLSNLEFLDLYGNPRLSLQLMLKFEPVQSASLVSGSTEVRLIMQEGAPFDITVNLSAVGGTVFPNTVTLSRGNAVSDSFRVSQGGSLPTVVTMSREPASPCLSCYYSGLTVAAGSSFTLDGIGPAVSGVEFISEPRQGDSYLVSRNETPPSLRLAVSFDETVIVSPSADGPVLALGIGETTRMASYDPDSSSTNRLIFHYQLTMDDFDNDGVSIAEDALRPNSATLGDAAGNEAELNLTSYAISNAAAHKVYRQSELSLATTRVEAVEPKDALPGEAVPEESMPTEAVLIVSATPPPHVNLDVGYRLSDEGGDADYSGPSAGSVSIPAGASTGTIRIPIKGDTVIEPPREFFTVTLTPPSPPTAYLLTSLSTATVVVKEGVCDRTRTVQLKILEKIAVGPGLSEALLLERCSGVDAEQLANLTGVLNLGGQRGVSTLEENDFEGLTGITSLSLNGNRIRELLPGVFRGLASLEELTLWNNRLTELPAELFVGLTNLQILNLSGNILEKLQVGLFTGLANLRELELNENQLSRLPAGLFEGLANLTKVWLHRNPGAPFTLKPRFEKVKPTGEPVPGVFRLRLVVDEGAPFVTTAVLTLQNATLSSMRVTIPVGSTASDVFTVTRHDADRPVAVYLNDPPPTPEALCGLYRCYRGIEIGKSDSFDPSQVNLRAVALSVPTRTDIVRGGSAVFPVTTMPVLVVQESARIRLGVSAGSGFSFILPDNSTSAVTEFDLNGGSSSVLVSVTTSATGGEDVPISITVQSTDNVSVNIPEAVVGAKLFSIPQPPPDDDVTSQGGSAPPTSMSQYAMPMSDSLPVSASLVFSPSTRVQVEQGRRTTFGVSVSPALVLGEALSLNLVMPEDEGQAVSGVTFAGSSSVQLTFDGGSPARERQVPVSASATAVIGSTVPVFAAEVAALSVSYAGKSPLLELSVSTPRVAVSFTPEVLPPVDVGGSATVSLGLRDDELQPGQQAKLRVQVFGVGWSVYPETVTLTAEAPVVEVSLRALDRATFGVLWVTALEGVELRREAVLEVQVEQ